MRSLLFVPGDSERKLARSLESCADAVIVDLEDSVAPGKKAAARELAATFIAGTRGRRAPIILFRINDLRSGLAEADLDAVMPCAPSAIMLPKCIGLADVNWLSTLLRVREARSGLEDGSTGILPLMTEVPQAIFAADTFATRHDRLRGVTWGAEDLSAEIGASAVYGEDGDWTDPFRLARSTTLFAAAACAVPAIDTVFTDFLDQSGLARQCAAAARDGFWGKLAIHPAQVPIINAAFTPSTEAINEAQAIVDAFARAGDVGVVAIGGKMRDRPHLKRAERLLARVQSLAPA